MKYCHVGFTDTEFNLVLQRKGAQNWREFILGLKPKKDILDLEREEGYILELIKRNGCSREEAIEGLKKERQLIKEEEAKAKIEGLKEKQADEVLEILNELPV